ncbi:MAG: TonB family protein [Acidobacteriota bacterium]
MKGIKLGWTVLVVLAFVVGSVIAQNTPKIIHGGVLNGKAVSLPKPMYPDDAKVAKVGGTVSVDVTIDEAGNVESAVARPDPNQMAKENMTVEQEYQSRMRASLRTAAENAARQAQFGPTYLNDIPVKVTGTIVYDFVADKSIDSSDSDKPARVRTVNGGVLNGKAIRLPHPAYPAGAKSVNAGGAVSVKVLVDESGNVISATAVSGHPLLREAAEKAALKAKFSPTLVDGPQVKVTGILIYNFVPAKSGNQTKSTNPQQ